jgi:uncharacterized protein (UPF0548 family)
VYYSRHDGVELMTGRPERDDGLTDHRSALVMLPAALVVAVGFWLLLAPTLLHYRDSGINAASWNDAQSRSET